MWGAIRNLADHVQQETLNGIAGANQLLEQLDHAIEEEDDDEDNDEDDGDVVHGGGEDIVESSGDVLEQEDEEMSVGVKDEGSKQITRKEKVTTKVSKEVHSSNTASFTTSSSVAVSSSDYEAVISSIQKSLQNMKDYDSVEEMRQATESIDKSVSSLRSICKSQKVAIEDLKLQHKTAMKEVKLLKKCQTEFESDVESLKVELRENNTAANKYKNQVNTLQKEMKSEREVGAKMKQEKDELVTKLTTQVQSLESELQSDRQALLKSTEEKDSLIDSLKQQLITLTNELADESVSYTTRNNSLAEIVKSLEADLLSQRDLYTKDIGEKDTVISELTKNAETLTQTLAKQQSEDSIVDITAATIESLKQDLQVSREEASTAAEEYNATIEQLKTELSNFNKQLQLERDEFVSFQNEKQIEVDNLNAKVVTLESEVHDATHQNSANENTKDERIVLLEKELEESKEACISLSDEKIALYEELKIKTAALEKELQAERDAIALFKTQESNMEERLLEEASRQQEDHATALADLREQISLLEAELKSERDNASQQLAEKSCELESQRDELTAAIAAQEQLRVVEASLREQLAQSLAEHEVQKEKYSELKQQQTAETIELTNKFESEMATQRKAEEDKVSALQMELEAERNSVSKDGEEKDTQVSELYNRVLNLSKELEESKEACISLSDEKIALYEELKIKTAALEKELQAERDAIALFKTQESNMEERLLEEASRQQEDHATALADLREQISLLEAELKSERDNASQQLAEKSCELESQRDELTAAIAAQEQLRVVEASLREQLAQSLAEHEVQKEKYSELKQQQTAETIELTNKFESEMATQRKAEEDKVSALQMELEAERNSVSKDGEEKDTQVSELYNRVLNLSKELEESKEELLTVKDSFTKVSEDNNVTVEAWMAQVSNLETECVTSTQRLESEHCAVVNKLNMTISSLEERLTSQCDETTLELQDKANEISSLQIKLSTAEETFAKATNDHNAMVEGLLKAQIDSTEKELAIEREKCFQQVQERIIEIEKLTQQLSVAEQSLSEATATASGLQEQLKTVNDRSVPEEDHLEHIEKMMKQIEQLEKDIVDEREANSNQVSFQRNEIDSYQEQLACKEEDLKRLMSDLNAEKEAFLVYKNEEESVKEKLQEQLSFSADAVKKAEENDKIIEKLRVAVASLEEELATERDKLSATDSSTDAVIQSLHQEAESLQSELSRVKASTDAMIATKTAEADDAVAKYAELTETHALAMSEIVDESNSLRAMLEKSETRVASLESALAEERQAADVESTATRSRLAALQDELNKLKQSSKSKIDGLQVLVTSLENELATEKGLCQKIQQDNSLHIENHKNKVFSLETELKEVRESFAEDRSIHEANLKGLQDQVADLSSQLAAEQTKALKLSHGKSNFTLINFVLQSFVMNVILFSFLDLNSLQYSEKDDGLTIRSLQEDIEKKNKQLDAMKKKDFDTLRKQNENISHLQREYDTFAQNATEQIQALTAEVHRYKQIESAGALAAHGDEKTTRNVSQVNEDSSEVSPLVDDVMKTVAERNGDITDGEVIADADEFRFQKKESNKEPLVANPLEVDLLAKIVAITSLEQEIVQLKSEIQSMTVAHASELAKLQEVLSKKDLYISSIKDEQYRQEREIAQLEEVIFEKKQTRQKVRLLIYSYASTCESTHLLC